MGDTTAAARAAPLVVTAMSTLATTTLVANAIMTALPLVDALAVVVLAGAGAQKIQVVKVVKDLLGVGLKDAKDLVDGAPKPILEKVSKDEAESAKAKLEEVGASVGTKAAMQAQEKN